ADRDLERARFVLQLGDVDLGFAFAADVDKRHLRTDRDDPALDGLPPREPLRLGGSGKQRGEILGVGLGHRGSFRSRFAAWYAKVAITTAACRMSSTLTRSTVSMLVWWVRMS